MRLVPQVPPRSSPRNNGRTNGVYAYLAVELTMGICPMLTRRRLNRSQQQRHLPVPLELNSSAVRQSRGTLICARVESLYASKPMSTSVTRIEVPPFLLIPLNALGNLLVLYMNLQLPSKLEAYVCTIVVALFASRSWHFHVERTFLTCALSFCTRALLKYQCNLEHLHYAVCLSSNAGGTGYGVSINYRPCCAGRCSVRPC